MNNFHKTETHIVSKINDSNNIKNSHSKCRQSLNHYVVVNSGTSQ